MKNIYQSLSIVDRTLVLAANLTVFYGIFCITNKDYYPTGGIESVWLLSAISMWFVTLLSSPWFLPPRDSLTNSIAVATILFTMEISKPLTPIGINLEIARWISILYALFISVCASLALISHDSNRNSLIGKLLFKFVGIFGNAKLIYTLPALISIIDIHQTNAQSLSLLVSIWTLYMISEPIASGFEVYRIYDLEKNHNKNESFIGSIHRIDHPNIIRVLLNNVGSWSNKKTYKAIMPTGEAKFVVPLFKQIQDEGVLGTGLCVGNEKNIASEKKGYVYLNNDEISTTEIIGKISGKENCQIAGITYEGSTIDTLRFQRSEDADLSEGDVIFTAIRDKDIFYQITNAVTVEENFDKSPFGAQIVEATQLGSLENNGFIKFPWLPEMNSPIFWAKNQNFDHIHICKNEFYIGRVPSTNIKIPANIDEIIVYHTAILGVTGTGKTELALEIVREAITKGKKVFCVDFTGEYRERLKDLAPTFPALSNSQCEELEQKLFDVETGNYGAGNEKKLLKSAIDEFKNTISDQITKFLEDDCSNLAILELLEITNSKATLRLTELYLSSIMGWAKDHRQSKQILLALEEAHTIIPESIGSGFDSGTQSVVSRIGQIALQGRKYGVGLLVISQRTALVSKTILSQCNTFFTHCLIDQTSLNFLESVYSKEHTHLIPNLPNLHFLAFGKAIRSDKPILLCKEFDQTKTDASNSINAQSK